MDETPPSRPDMRDLMAVIGEVLLCWGFLEGAIGERIAPTYSKIPIMTRWREADGNNPKFAELYAEIKEAAFVRHCIAHGLRSASANPWSNEEPTIICITANGDRQSITMSQMNDVKRTLRSLTKRIRDLSV